MTKSNKEVRSQKPEARSQKSEVRSRKSEAGSQKLEAGSRTVGIVFLFLLFALCSTSLSLSSLGAEEKKPVAEKKPAVAEKKPAKVPTVITSQSLTADNKAKNALFEGSVVAKKGEMTLFSDKMMVYYAEEKGSSNIKRIDAEGNVKLIKGDRVVTSKFATYFAEPEEHTIFTGEPKAMEGENVVTGTKMIYFMNDDRSIVENSKVLIVNKDMQK